MLLGESYYLLKLGTAGAFEKQTVCVCVCVMNIILEAEAFGSSAWQATGGGVRRCPIINQNTAQG